ANFGSGTLAHVPAKWPPVRRQGHAPTRESGAHPDSAGMGCALEMENFLRFLLRLPLVPLGGAVAVVAAMAVVLAGRWGEIVALANARPDAQDDWLLALIFTGPILALLLSMTLVVTALPAAVGALIAEAFAIRSWIYHAANGGVSAWIGWSI